MNMNRIMRIPFTRIEVHTTHPQPFRNMFFAAAKGGDADWHIWIGKLHAMIYTNCPPLEREVW